ncbi:STAS-like domain-containing protein [Metabacillus indicus]|uniref:STAS-like domain-containing protein n=1 Tax=Metabacillus indicus TaxID=246786 RepID=UPI002A05ECA7|nr:STAS-like domain-containing protein [Metabacillus indicus]MDX8291435.1 STAS-like domain-containing protein [Metabacillus indicus]
MVIKVIDHVGRCYSNQDGLIIKDLIQYNLKQDEKITVSFEGIDGVTSSFINSALIELIEEYDFTVIKNNITFTKSNKQINNMIKDRFSFELKRRKQTPLTV